MRQAVDQDASARRAVDEAHRRVVLQITMAWNSIKAAQARRKATGEAQAAASLAFEGAHDEFGAGFRTTLDVLLAQLALRDANLAVINGDHDEFVAKIMLLAAIGRLDADGAWLA